MSNDQLPKPSPDPDPGTVALLYVGFGAALAGFGGCSAVVIIAADKSPVLAALLGILGVIGFYVIFVAIRKYLTLGAEPRERSAIPLNVRLVLVALLGLSIGVGPGIYAVYTGRTTLPFASATPVITPTTSNISSATSPVPITPPSSITMPQSTGTSDRTLTIHGHIVSNLTYTEITSVCERMTSLQCDKVRNKYNGKWVKWSGTVADITSDPWVVLHLGGSDSYQSAIVDFQPSYKEDVIHLRVGDRLTILGQVEDEIGNVTNAEILDNATADAARPAN